MAITLSWDANPQCAAWSSELLASVSAHLQSLELGAPEQFVAGYVPLFADKKLTFWAEIIIAMIKFKSDFNPHCIYHEPPPLGTDSVGLLPLSYEDQNNYDLEPLDKAKKSLEDPLVSIRCGLATFSHWLAKDQVIAKGAGKQSRGAARYWSVMREGHHVEEIKAHARKSVGL